MYERKDTFYRKAKAEGYRSRSAYKLLELQKRFHVIGKNARVLDLGCAPGGWLQVCLEILAGKGSVTGVDLEPLHWAGGPNLRFVRGDFTDAAVQDQVRAALGGRATAVLSDMAPHTSGHRVTDCVRSVELGKAVLEQLPVLLEPGGNCVVKVFMGAGTDEFAGAFRRHFTAMKRTRPEATRKASFECYFIGLGYRGEAVPGEVLR